MRQLLLLAVFFVVFPIITYAEGLLQQLPEDGVWARYEINGKGVASDGTVKVILEGSQTIRSVGSVTVDGEKYRWVEFENEIVFKRDGIQAREIKDIIKLLIPELNVVKEKNPCQLCIKYYKGISSEKIKEVNLKVSGENIISRMDEMFHAPLKAVSKLPSKDIITKEKTWTCEGYKAETVTDSYTLRTETRVHKESPFGVITYKFEKERFRNNQPQGMKTMEWKFVESGTNARSAAPDAI